MQVNFKVNLLDGLNEIKKTAHEAFRPSLCTKERKKERREREKGKPGNILQNIGYENK